MQFLSGIGPVRGKAGGTVASDGRAGAQLRARVTIRNPNTTRQRNARALFAALTGAWRSLTPQQRAAWNDAAEPPATGLNLFTACNRNLATLSQAPLLTTPQPRPAFPPIEQLTAAAIYDSTGPTTQLQDFIITTEPAPPVNVPGVLRASMCLSAARANVPLTLLRVAAISNTWPGTAILPTAPWLALFGIGPSVGAVTFALHFIDPASGYASTPATATAAYSTTDQAPPATWSTTIEQEGSPIATITETVFEQGNEGIAGP